MAAPSVQGLVTDLYQLTMLQAYLEHGMHAPATFELFTRRLPPNRNFLVAAGLDAALDYLEQLRFEAADIEYLESLGSFSADFLDYLGDFRFSGSVDALPEGTPFFANEPLLTVHAPLPEAQLIETRLLNLVQLPTAVASKAARVVAAADGRSVIDFGLRHAHGADASFAASRAAFIAGVQATSNVAAGQTFGIPVAGTMAHSFVQAHDSEREAFVQFAATFPGATLLVDTYDTEAGVERVIELVREAGNAAAPAAVRLDSGDLAAHARRTRRQLDAAGLAQVQVIASGNLDEHEIARLVADSAPIDSFGVGRGAGRLRGRAVLGRGLQAGGLRRTRTHEARRREVHAPGPQAGIPAIRRRHRHARRRRARQRTGRRSIAARAGDAWRQAAAEPPPVA